MELRVLKNFLVVAREKSITRAAHVLHITQPAISKQLKDLEAETRCELFTRTPHGIALTEAGMLLQQRARDIIDMVERTEGELTQLNADISGDVHIGCAESRNMRNLARCVRAVQKQHPRIRVHLYSGNANDLADRIDAGFFDFAVTTREPDPARYHALAVPGYDTFGVIMRADDPLAHWNAIPRDELVSLPLILSQQAMADDYPALFGEQMEQLDVVATYNLAYNATALAAEGVGYTLALDGLLDTGPMSGLVFRPIEPALTSRLYVIWRHHQVFSSAAEQLLQEMQARFEPYRRVR